MASWKMAANSCFVKWLALFSSALKNRFSPTIFRKVGTQYAVIFVYEVMGVIFSLIHSWHNTKLEWVLCSSTTRMTGFEYCFRLGIYLENLTCIQKKKYSEVWFSFKHYREHLFPVFQDNTFYIILLQQKPTKWIMLSNFGLTEPWSTWFPFFIPLGATTLSAFQQRTENISSSLNILKGKLSLSNVFSFIYDSWHISTTDCVFIKDLKKCKVHFINTFSSSVVR